MHRFFSSVARIRDTELWVKPVIALISETLKEGDSIVKQDRISTAFSTDLIIFTSPPYAPCAYIMHFVPIITLFFSLSSVFSRICHSTPLNLS